MLSTAKRRHDGERRRARIKRASEYFDDLKARLVAPKARIRIIDAALRAADEILAENRTVDYFDLPSRVNERAHVFARRTAGDLQMAPATGAPTAPASPCPSGGFLGSSLS